MTTVTAVKRAIEECIDCEEPGTNPHAALVYIASNPRIVTMIANNLGNRGTAGNAARDRNIADLRQQRDHWKAFQASARMVSEARALQPHIDALEWAIDQLSRPQPFNVGDVIGAARNPGLLYVVDQVNDDGTLDVHIKDMKSMDYPGQPPHLFVHVVEPSEPQMQG